MTREPSLRARGAERTGHRTAASATRRLLVGAVVLAGGLTLASCTSDAPSPTPTTASPSPTPSGEPGTAFAMNFDEGALLASEPAGDATVTQENFFGGALTLVTSFRGNGQAIQFPASTGGEEEPGVGLVAFAAAAPLPNPGTAPFGFGADVRFDDIGAATANDNGDNVIQRGLAADPTQYKLQVDKGAPSCTVTGAGGRLIIKGDTLENGLWYRLACLLDADGLTLTVTDLDAQTTAEFAAPGTVGAVSFAEDVPVAIGRKAGPDGAGIIDQPDQFNGTMDAIWIRVEPVE